ncbi:MAG TPA: hypothetical protein VG722_02695 [Tepidisphaeraceae bacterium]|nr:hypothetical protein [Tepidisphaeraceae bacterium]
MTGVEEIKTAIQKLPPAGQTKLVQWINDWADDQWDRQMKEDLAAGRLDELLSRVRTDIRADNLLDMP